MESDFALSKAPHSIHSSFDSISMMSSVSMEKLASKVQDAEAPVEVASRRRHHIGHAHHGGDHHAVGHGDQQHGSHWSGRTSPSNSGVGEPRYVLPSTAMSLPLRELAIHQIGSHLSLYKNLLVGDARVSHEPFLERGVVGEPSQSQVKIAKTAKQGSSRTSLLFSCEDFDVDSTSVLKDSRHPSHTHLHTPTG